MLPRLHITNYSSLKLYGPGRWLSIQAIPPDWTAPYTDGNVPFLIPIRADLVARHAGEMSHEDYKATLTKRWEARQDLLRPGTLMAQVGFCLIAVEEGDTLLCTCSRDKARQGRCHRAWMAPYLAAAGWEVILDGDVFGVSDGGILSMFGS